MKFHFKSIENIYNEASAWGINWIACIQLQVFICATVIRNGLQMNQSDHENEKV